MKILILYHTLWTEMLADCWKKAEGLEIMTFFLPLDEWRKNPAVKFETARMILSIVKTEKPAFILDINGAGILPLDETHEKWTSQELSVPYCEWWWDDPNNNTPLFYSEHYHEWFKALKSPDLVHFMWDAVLAEEYSKWFGVSFRYLPTATHPGAFNPEAAKLSKRKFGRPEISFLGSFYGRGRNDKTECGELELLSFRRLVSPCKNYFEIIEECDCQVPLFAKIMKLSLEAPAGIFLPEMHRWRNALNCFTGVKRRNRILADIVGIFKSRLIAGYGFPASFDASSDTFYQPLDLCACYRASVLNLDLGNAQSFTGTNMRSYEIMSCAALLARNEKPDFDPDASLEKHVYLRFSSAGELHELYREYSADKDKFNEICANARQYVLENHSWLNRLAAIIPVLSEKISLK